MSLGKPVLPKEHGIWVVLLTPLAVGSFAIVPEDGYKILDFALFAVCSTLGMFALEPVKLIAKPVAGIGRERVLGWLLVYSSGAALSLLIVIVHLGRWGLLWLGVPAALMVIVRMWSSAARALRALEVEFLGVFGLAITAPVASYIQTGEITTEAMLVYLLMVIWFTDRLMTARRTLEWVRGGRGAMAMASRIGWYKKELVIHFGSLASAALVIAVSGGRAPWAAFLPFLLATAKNGFDILLTQRPPGPMRIGFTEMGLGIAFGLCMIAAWLLG